MDVLVGSAASLNFELQGPTGALPPDAASAFWSLYSHTGILLSGPTLLVTTPTTTNIPIPVAAVQNTISGALFFEKRTLVLTWVSSGQSHTVIQTYRIIPLLPITSGPAQVRSILSLTEEELRDDEIDLVGAYMEVSVELVQNNAPTPLLAMLVSGDRIERAANQVLEYHALLPLLVTIELRAAVAMGDGTQSLERFKNIDFNELRANLRGERARVFNVLVTGGAKPDVNAPLRTALTTPIDVITAA